MRHITPGEWRKYNHDFVTRRFKRVQECAHRFDEEREPRTNCPFCWFAYLSMHGEMVKTADLCFQEEGRDILERVKGKKFTKMFLRFMSTIAQFEKAQKEKNVTGITAADRQDGDIQTTNLCGGSPQQEVLNNEQPSTTG